MSRLPVKARKQLVRVKPGRKSGPACDRNRASPVVIVVAPALDHHGERFAETWIVMRYWGSVTDALMANVGAAFKLTVRVDRCVPRFNTWKTMPMRAVEAPTARAKTAATQQPGGRGDAPGRARATARGMDRNRSSGPRTCERRDQGRDLPKCAPARAEGGS
jgi:hypothetical protein